MSKYENCLSLLLEKAEKLGYLTFDIIMDTTDAFDLSLSDVDRVSEAIQIRGIIVYETSPVDEDVEEVEDYSRVDYNSIFREIIDMAEELEPLIDFIRDLPPPQHKEVALLCAQIANGNPYARERLIFLHMRVVIKIALHMSKQHELDIVDAVSCGLVGLITAVDKYKQNSFSAFQSYASMWIQQSIQRDCYPVWLEFYHPAHVKDKILALLQCYSEEIGDFIDDCIDEELIAVVAGNEKFSDLTKKKLLEYIHLIKTQKYNFYSHEDIVILQTQDEKNSCFAELICDDEVYFVNVERSVLREILDDLLDTLQEREKEILILRNGLRTGEEMTLEEVGDVFDLSRERIRQIEAKAIRKLRHPSRCKRLKDFY